MTARGVLVLGCLAALALAPCEAVAGRLLSLDPRIGAPAAPGADATQVHLPRPFLERELLLTTTIVATSSTRVILGVAKAPVLVKPRVTDGAVELVRVRAPIGGSADLAGQALATWPARADGDGLAVTPELAFETSTLAGTMYAADRPTGAQDVQVDADRMAVTLHYDAAVRGVVAKGDPESVQVAVRLTLFYRPAPATPGRAYGREDAKRVGLFTLGYYESGITGVDGDLAVRPDPKQPLRVVIHPTVPAPARPVIQAAVAAWNDALERVAHARPLTVEETTDATLMPGTPGVAVVYWFGHDVKEAFIGYTQSLADPRNGEVLGGQILISEEQLTGAGALQALADEAVLKPAAALAPSVYTPEPGATGARPAMDVLAWTMVHELGHLLGLRHNYRASADVGHTAAGDHSTSCMDYLPTPLAPRKPLGYDEHALAFALGVPPPAGAEGPFAFASDEALYTDPDANQYDAGEPLAWARGYTRSLREHREASPITRVVEVEMGVAKVALAGAIKMAALESDPRHAQALRFLLGLAADQGADPVTGGGLAGKTEGDAPDEAVRAKNLPQRLAAITSFVELAQSGRLQAPERDVFLRTLARTALDAPRTDLYTARKFALTTLTKLEGPDVRNMLWTLLSTLQRELVKGARTPTYQQDVQLFQRGRTHLAEAKRR